jgi:tetratricopeptide (TPR) repeat protein
LEGHDALQANNLPKAIEDLEQAKVAYPNNEGVYTDLGLAYLSTKNFDKGIEALTKASRLYPDNPMVFYYLGIAYAQTSPPNYDYTQRYMRKALELNPGFQQAQNVLDQLSQMQSSPSQFR